jgi:hypothetical protein
MQGSDFTAVHSDVRSVEAEVGTCYLQRREHHHLLNAYAAVMVKPRSTYLARNATRSSMAACEQQAARRRAVRR